MHKILIAILILGCTCLGVAQEFPDGGELVSNPDSVLQTYTIDDLIEYQQRFSKETEQLLDEKSALRLRAIQDLEAFIKGHPDSPFLDKIIIRLADLHYQQSMQNYTAAMDEYTELISMDSLEQMPDIGAEPELDLSRSIGLYRRLAKEFPHSEFLDDAIYNQAFLYEDLGEKKEAFKLFQEIVAAHPESEFVPDALMQMAEYHFNPPRRNLETAITLYKKILDYKDSARYDAALYRLGWAYYILNDYPRAISYFTFLVDDLARVKKLDPEQKYHLAAVNDEAIEYIGIGFLDFGGPQKAAQFFDQIGGRNYGYEVMQKIGDVYLDVKEEYSKAVDAYTFLLAMYPDSPESPKIQAKIAEAYRHLEDEKMAYARRTELFQKYSAGSEWWNKVSDTESKKQASQLAEKAMRDNIAGLLKQAEENEDKDLYARAINDARAYLARFPDDTSAVRIHWNMALALDTKLGKPDDAFDEYLKISNRYWNSKFQKQAAANAIAILDEALRQDSVDVESIAGVAEGSNFVAGGDSGSWVFTPKPEPLSDDEAKLAYALNNYAKLFPHDPETAKMLERAGALYYNRNHFKESIKYFKTLIKHFPDSPKAGNAYYLTMESYFGKGDYESSEIMAQKIKHVAPEYAANANKRLAESIFLKAKIYADSRDHVKAGDEYRRMVQELPTVEFADLALYNAGRQFDKADEFQKAIESYNRLLLDYPQSGHHLDALNNLAFDYRELMNYGNAAMVYERLAEKEPGAEKAQVALYNASVSYVHAENWLKAINVNNRFVDRFPESADADALLFSNAHYYLKLNDLANANSIYARFTEKFPNSERVVEAFYRRGDYYFRNNLLPEAKVQFSKAVEKSEAFKKEGKEANEFYTSEALFHLAEIKYGEFERIQFSLPESSILANKKLKKEMLLDLVNNYTEAAKFGTYRLYAATYRIGNAYEDFAKTWAGQEIPKMDTNKRIMKQKEIHAAAADLFEKSVDAYKNGVKVLERLSHFYRDSAAAEVDTTGGKLAEFAVDDSTAASAAKWIARCKDKVSENLYLVADFQTQSLNQLLNAPKPAGMSQIEEMVYRQQVLAKAVAPIVAKVVAAHTRNLNESAEYELSNEWVRKSRDEIVRAVSIVPDEFQRLSETALMTFGNNVARFEQLVETDEDAAFDLAEQLTSILELSGKLVAVAAHGNKTKIASLRSLAIDSPEVAKTETALVKNIVQYIETTDSLATRVSGKRNFYDRKFKETDDVKYEDAYFTYDDLAFSLLDRTQELAEFGYKIDKEQNLNNEWSRRLLLALVKINPEQYAAESGMNVENLTIPSSSDWVVSLEWQSGWTSVDFADSTWSNAIADGASAEFSGKDAQIIWFAQIQTTAGASGAATNVTAQESNMPAFAYVRPEKVYFRKTFEVAGTPLSAKVEFKADDSYKLFLNGQSITEYEFDPEEEPELQSVDLKDYLRNGKNVLAIAVHDFDTSNGSLEAVIEIKYLLEENSDGNHVDENNDDN